MHDRSKLDPQTLEKMRDELISVITKYVEIDGEALRLNFETESNTIALMANIPVLRQKEANDANGSSSTVAKPEKSEKSSKVDKPEKATKPMKEKTPATTVEPSLA